jgi:hypothetical protein
MYSIRLCQGTTFGEKNRHIALMLLDINATIIKGMPRRNIGSQHRKPNRNDNIAVQRWAKLINVTPFINTKYRYWLEIAFAVRPLQDATK